MHRSVLSICLMSCAAQADADVNAQACTAIADNRDRLACYDASFGRGPREQVQAAAVVTGAEAPANVEASSWMAALWDLDRPKRAPLFHVRGHAGNYLLPVRHSSRPNFTPSSPAPDHRLPNALPLDSTEAKYQLSLKFKVAEDVLGDRGDLWFGYTQQAHWQLYNKGFSSPFRETNYEPEAVLAWRVAPGTDVAGWQWRLLNFGLVHQSNGQISPLSRSWNRVYAAFGLERGDWSLFIRPWVRLHEKANDDNPDIERYLGHGDVRIAYTGGKKFVSLLGRYAGSGRGFVRLDTTFPLHGALSGYAQLTHGYGESLIDYNHRQTTFGVGIALTPFR